VSLSISCCMRISPYPNRFLRIFDVSVWSRGHKPRVAQRIQKGRVMRVELRVQDAEQHALARKMLGKTARRIALHFVDMRKLARRIQARKQVRPVFNRKNPGNRGKIGRGMLASFEGHDIVDLRDKPPAGRGERRGENAGSTRARTRMVFLQPDS